MAELSRKNLALAALVMLLLSLGNTSASVLSPAKTLRGLAGRQLWVPICSRRGVNGSAAWFDNVNTAVMDQVACFAPSFGTVTAIKLVYAAFDMPQQGEIDRPVTATGSAAVYVPGANSTTIFANGAGSAGATNLNFSATSLGANGVSVGQLVTSTGGGLAANTFVAAVSNVFAAGAGNNPTATTVTLSAATTAATAAGQTFNFTGLFVPVKFGGKRQFTIEPAHDVVTSDPVGVQLSPNAAFFVRTAASFSAAGMQLMDYPGSGSRLTGEFDNRGTSFTDQTMTPAALSNTGGGFWCPVAVLGLVTVTAGQLSPGAVLILGDSIAAGTGDNADSLGLQGYIQRSLENTVPFVTGARGSTTATGLAAHGDGQYALSVDTGITDILLEDGRNDVSSFQVSDTVLESTIAQIARRYVAAGKRVWCFTVPPTTQSNDGWVSLANQSWTVAVNNSGATTIAAGSTSLAMASVANLSVGQAVSGTGIAAGTVISSIGGSTITVSAATNASIPPSTKLSFGSTNPGSSSSETYRKNYNGFLRTAASSLGCAGVIDVDKILSDQSGLGKWRVDLGAASADGVHPSPALHQAVVSAGVISASMFQAQ